MSPNTVQRSLEPPRFQHSVWKIALFLSLSLDLTSAFHLCERRSHKSVSKSIPFPTDCSTFVGTVCRPRHPRPQRRAVSSLMSPRSHSRGGILAWKPPRRPAQHPAQFLSLSPLFSSPTNGNADVDTCGYYSHARTRAWMRFSVALRGRVHPPPRLSSSTLSRDEKPFTRRTPSTREAPLKSCQIERARGNPDRVDERLILGLSPFPRSRVTSR